MAHKAFVSSTFKDLKDHRMHVIRNLRRAGIDVNAMEDWPADSDEPKKFSQVRLNECAVCLLLVAFRRGFVPKGESRSITQLEYDAALKQGMDVLVFMLDDDAYWQAKFDEREKDPALKVWRTDLQERHGSELFTHDPSSIDLTGALGRWLEKKSAGQSELRKSERSDWPDGKSPYPGLLWFNEEYAPLFFGRDQEVDMLVNKMSEPGGRVLLVSGASGSGKSSLVAAGLWYVLKNGRLPESQQWKWCPVQPSEPSKAQSPFEALALGLKGAFRGRISISSGDLGAKLAGHETTIGKLLALHLDQGQELVVFIDQLEELFTQGFKNEDIKTFLEQLVMAAREKQNRFRVVATVRSEFTGRLVESEAVRQIFNAGYNYHLGPVSPRTLQDMIERPAQATGYVFEPQLVDIILRDAAQEPGSLPLVAYALEQLFKRRDKDKRTFTHDAYKAIGGVAGAIGMQADQVMDELAVDVPGAFDRVFSELVQLERGRPPLRKRPRLDTFIRNMAANQLIEALAGQDCRILVKGKEGAEEGAEATVEMAHEKLFVAWPKLKKWIDSSGTDLRLIDYEEESAIRWHELTQHLQEPWQQERVQAIQKALARFNKTASPCLEKLFHPQQIRIERLEIETLSHQERLQIGKKTRGVRRSATWSRPVPRRSTRYCMG
ncbi:MAG: DUF4062 domain-containing protein [Nitrospira sp.]|nr:MAG: DUF4062 domain-containing protein [Nitrospira sp.]